MMASTHRVLLVDDEPALLSPLRRVVERAAPGAVVVYASDADTAVWQIESTSVRLVLTDLRMQNVDDAGIAVVKAAMENQVPVAVITGMDNGELRAWLEARKVPVVLKSTMSTAQLTALVEEAFAPK